MSYTEAPVANVEQYINDPEWVFEQKLDGTRCLAVVTSTHVRFLQRSGKELTHAAAALHFEKIREGLKPIQDRLRDGDEVVLDGEIMFDVGRYYVYDLPFANIGPGKINPFPGGLISGLGNNWSGRVMWLELLFAYLVPENDVVKTVNTAFTALDKARLFKRVTDSNGEGVVAKNVNGIYQPGKRVKDILKFKLIKTVDCVVTKSTRGRNEAGRETGAFYIAVYDEATGQRVPLGSTSAIGKEDAKEGDVIEVAYLSYAKGGSLVQPRMLKIRTDKRAEECFTDQLITTSKEVVSHV
jgi:bifunctional non-homologous end joining protein LigD